MKAFLFCLIAVLSISSSQSFAGTAQKCNEKEAVYSFVMKLQEYMSMVAAIDAGLESYPEITKQRALNELKRPEMLTLFAEVDRAEKIVQNLNAKVSSQNKNLLTLIKVNELSLKSGKLQMEIRIRKIQNLDFSSIEKQVKDLAIEVQNLNNELKKMNPDDAQKMADNYIQLFGAELCKK